MEGVIGRKAVLVYPQFLARTFWSFHDSLEKYSPKNRFGLSKQPLPPLGLMGLYNHLKPFYDNLVLIDRNTDTRPLERLVSDADHVYMGGMIAQEECFVRDARIVKKAGKVLVAGGTIVDEKSPLMDIADHLVENEAEMVIDDLLDGLARGKAEKFYRGTPAVPDRFFLPDFSSININNYLNVPIQISRGCPHDCEFCDITARFGRKSRMAPWAHTETALRQLHELGSKNPIFFVDDNFIGNPKQAVEILKKIYALEKKQGYHSQKLTELTMRLADDSPVMQELKEWFHKTNFVLQFIGVETNNSASLRETGKNQNLQGEKSMVEKLRHISEKTGAGVMMGMIHGFDNDTRSVDSLIEFINSTHAPIVMTGLLNALPYTKLGERLKIEGRLMSASAGNNSDGTINFVPYNFSAKQAEEDYVKILEGIYNEKAFFTRVLREFELLNPASPYNQRTPRESLCSTLKVMTGENALTFWKYLPKAHSIAKKRFGFNTPGYQYVVAEYIIHCGKFTHFKNQTQMLKNQLKQKSYEPWQLYSWREVQESPVTRVEHIEPEIEPPVPSLFDKIRVQLHNGYEYMGTRLEALAHFIGPSLKEELRKLQNKIPTFEQLVNAQIRAYWKAHLKRPQILEKLKFAELENYLRETTQNQVDYFNQMRNTFRNAMLGMAGEPASEDQQP